VRRNPVLLILALCVLAAAACATDSDDDFISTDLEEESELEPKADQPLLPFTVVDGLELREAVGRTEEGRVIRTATAYRSAFGTAPPKWLDFSKEWLAVYTAGVKSTGGYAAEILQVRLSDTGKSLKVVSRLTSPGAGCFVTFALTKPTVVVRFPAQPGAGTSRFTKQSLVQDCTSTQACGAALQSELASAADGLLYMSESDYPLDVRSYPGAGAPTVAKLLALTNTPAGTLVEERSFDQTMDRLGEAYDPDDDYLVEYAARFRALRAVMETQLTDLTVIRIGEIQVHVFFVGKSACGDLVGYETISIET
jgi:hypothetical protein